MKSNIFIRAYTPADKQQIIQLLQLNTPTYFSPEEEKDLIHYLNNEIELYYVIEIEQQVVGCGGINFSEDKKTGIISWDILHPEFQGKSLGRSLLNYRIEQLKKSEGIQKITVRTSQLVYPFYEKGGFKLNEIVKDYWAKGYDLYRMEYEFF